MNKDTQTQDKERFHFHKTKFSALDGTTKVRFLAQRHPWGEQEEFFVEASPKGVELVGKLLIVDREMLEPMAKAIGDAYKEFLKLKPRLEKTLSGH